MTVPNLLLTSPNFTRQILVVEDDFENRAAMVRFLGGAGYKTTETDNGEEAINQILKQNIDIVGSDLHLPVMNGVELLKPAKTASPDVAVTMMTGYGTVEVAVEAVKKGAYDFVTKPIRKALLLHCFEKAIRATAARRKMEADRELFARLVHSSSDAILTSTLDGTATSVNPAAEALFGYSTAELLGRPGFLARLVPTERAGETMEILERMGEGSAVELETVRIRKNGSRCAVSLVVSPVRNAQGCLIGFSEVIRDITDRQRQMQRREFIAEAGKTLVSSLDYKETLKTVANLLVRKLADCCIIDIIESDGSFRWLACEFSEPSREGLRERLLKYPLRKSPSFAREVFEGGGPILMREVPDGFIEYAAEDAEQCGVLSELDPKSFMAVPLKARGHVLGALVLISTHPERQYEPNDLPFAEEIAAIAALAIDNARLFARAQRAVSARDAVLAVVAHDLRNPLNNIMMSAAWLSANLSAEADPARRFACQALKAGKQMERLIQDLLDITSMEAGQFSINRKPVPASSLVAEALENNRSHLDGRELRAELPIRLPNVDADSGRIAQVFSNLIGNAIKFTPKSADIVIGAVPEGDAVRFWVSDNGLGISPEQVPHLFSRFWQATKADRRGIGLGLSICKGIVEAHGGIIWVDSKLAHGCTFSFSLPIAPVATAVRAEPSSDADVELPLREASTK